MASLAQATAYLLPSLEFAAKLSSIIPMWLLLVIADKHFLGLPLLEGSLWRSPRIPPRFSVTARNSVEHVSRSKRRGGSAQHGFKDFIPPSPQPSQLPNHLPDALPLRTPGPTTVSIYQPLEVHDPFNSSSRWLEPSDVGCVVLLALMITFLGIILTKGRGHPFGKRQLYQTNDIETPSPDPLSGQGLTEKLEFPVYWEHIPISLFNDTAAKDTIVQTVEQRKEDMKMKVEKVGDIKEDLEELLGPIENKKGDQGEKEGEKVTEMERGKSTEEEQIEKTRTDFADTGENRKDCDGSGRKVGDEDGQGHGDSKGDRKDAWKADIKEHRLSDSGEVLEDDGLDGSPVVGQRTKKKRIRTNAKKRAAKRAAAEEAEEKHQEALNLSFGDAKEHEEGKGMPDEAESADWPETALGSPPEENRKKARRRRRGRKPETSLPDNTISDIGQRDKTQVRQTYVGVQSNDSIVVRGKGEEAVARRPEEPILESVQTKGDISSKALFREGNVRLANDINTTSSQPQEPQGTGDYQRLRSLLKQSASRLAQPDNETGSNAPPGGYERVDTPRDNRFQSRTPFETPVPSISPGRTPSVSSDLPNTERSYPYDGNPHVSDTSAGQIGTIDINRFLTVADRSDERYQYFPERGVRSRSFPPRSRSPSRSPALNRRPQSLPPRRLSYSETGKPTISESEI